MKLIKTKIPGPLIIKSKIHRDRRGFLRETFRNNLFKSIKFPFEILLYSKKNVLRGIHIQTSFSQDKVLTVTKGRIFDIAVDLRKGSKFFGKYVSVYLSDKDDYSFFIPKGFGHGFLCLTKDCMVNYKCSNYRNSKYEKTIIWNDPDINIKWPCKKPILSNKDKAGLSLQDFT